MPTTHGAATPYGPMQGAYVGCTTNYIAADKDDNDINANYGDVTDDRDTNNLSIQ